MTAEEIEAACWNHIQRAENWMTPEFSDGYNENEVYRAWNHGYNTAVDEYKAAIKEYAKQECIAVLDSIRTYHQENGNTGFAYDDRTSEELYQIYIDSKTKQI